MLETLDLNFPVYLLSSPWFGGLTVSEVKMDLVKLSLREKDFLENR